jgi:hypothetical protein
MIEHKLMELTMLLKEAGVGPEHSAKIIEHAGSMMVAAVDVFRQDIMEGLNEIKYSSGCKTR